MARKPRLPARPSTVPTTQIIMLGTGTPRPDPARSGPATGIVVNGTPYLVDSGPGVVRRIAAAYEKGITEFGFAAIALRTIFLTHLHADHTAGYPDLILTPWILGRRQPLEVYGPKGLRSMTEHVLEAWEIDIEDRLTGIDRLPPRGCRVNAHEVAPGVIYVDRNIRVTAFPVRHGDLAAFGFRFETPDRIIVISGDTAPTLNLVEHSEGCDVLIHEAYSERTYEGLSPKWQRYRRSHHTSSRQLPRSRHACSQACLFSITVRTRAAARRDRRILRSSCCAKYAGFIEARLLLDMILTFSDPVVRFESGADIPRLLSNVRFTPQSGQSADMLACPLIANFRH